MIGTLVWSISLCGFARGWTELEGVVFETDGYSDGDSFRAKRNSSKYMFRLYFVDAPETDDRFESRVLEQAAYFGVTKEEVMKAGEKAGEWMKELLGKETITVFTRYTDARGASDRKRYFAMVKVGDRWLSELLVEQGLARIYGMQVELPDGTSFKKYWRNLERLEKEAKERNRGLWGVASGTPPADPAASGKTTLKTPTAVFEAAPPHNMVGTLPVGWEVEVGGPTRPGFRSVTFISSSGNPYTGEILESQVPR